MKYRLEPGVYIHTFESLSKRKKEAARKDQNHKD